ncbi:Zinc finger, NF-X1-type [Ceratobasidium sp. AG-Ba]|nr:Zinc finger, NF-X1-type [Ceratobasidium sp. AG-Ba]
MGFRSSTQVYLFLESLNSARPSNTSWVSSSSANLLEALVNPPNGLIRLTECIKRPSEPGNMANWSFIRGTLPVLEYMSSEWVIRSTINHNVNALYGILHHNFQTLQNTIETFMPRMMEARAFRDTGETTKAISGLSLFTSMFVAFFEYTCRYQNALKVNLGMRGLIEQLAKWFYEWESAIESSAPFDDPCQELTPPTRRFRVSELRKKVEPLLNVINRTRVVVHQPSDPQQEVQQNIAIYRHEATLARLQREFQGPGNLRTEGPRHDNDKVEIQEIRIAPTQEELLCRLPPYLPGNIPGAPHQHAAEDVQRLLDIQFRLLREELVAPIRSAIQLLSDDLAQPGRTKTQLGDIMKAGGGRYRGQVDAGQDSVIFSVFTNVTFGPFTVDRRGCSVGLFMDTPPGADARHKDAKNRISYWETASKKRLAQGGLVALLIKDKGGPLEIFVGLIASNAKELKESAQNSPKRIGIRVSFFDAEIELRAARQLQENQKPPGDQTRLLLEAPVLYEGIRPFLSALQVEPERLPFANYLRHHIDPEYLSRLPITPPLYAQRPGFSFDLKPVLRRDSTIGSLRLDANDPLSVANARKQLAESSSLDGSQADAVVDALTREISLIQGPPGTGKSYTGIEIIKLLVKNGVTPIVLMAFTNHALDHMLLSVLDNVTKNVARLGSRSADERISQFSLDKLTRDSSEHKGIIGRKYAAMKETEEEMDKLMNAMTKKHVPRQDINETVLLDCPDHYDNIFVTPPRWIGAYYAEHCAIEDSGWDKQKTKKGNPNKLDFWRDGRDIEWLTPPVPKGKARKSNNADGHAETIHQVQVQKHRSERLIFLQEHGESAIPPIPAGNRSLATLQEDARVWSMSIQERKKLFQHWKLIALKRTSESRLANFTRFRQNHAEARQEYQDTQDQVQVNLLKGTHVIGCTTTGAAKLVSLFASIEPQVMIVEEAGQVLEAHVLATLVPSISQVIMIGDPKQLRPNLVNYKLSIDNYDTGKIYRFDRSLMERLSDSGLHMSRLDVQRRMRPEISSLIRNTLYEGLIDNPHVKNYPNVRGMQHNMFFMSHCHREAGGGDDSVSKYNQYEVDMIYGLVKHLLRQGCYGVSSDSGTIVVLSAYLGQIPKINAKFRGEITTVVDERDMDQLAEQGIDTDIATVGQVELSKRVLVRTLDNFQGEEGDIIILSLARNAGSPFVKDVTNLEYDKTAKSSVGFLKSINRTNVGLSRAKQGLYILGNAPELATASKMWATVLQELDSKNLIGQGFPIACSRHPDYIRAIDHPDMFAVHAPDAMQLPIIMRSYMPLQGEPYSPDSSVLIPSIGYSVTQMIPIIWLSNAQQNAQGFVHSSIRAENYAMKIVESVASRFPM